MNGTEWVGIRAEPTHLIPNSQLLLPAASPPHPHPRITSPWPVKLETVEQQTPCSRRLPNAGGFEGGWRRDRGATDSVVRNALQPNPRREGTDPVPWRSAPRSVTGEHQQDGSSKRPCPPTNWRCCSKCPSISRDERSFAGDLAGPDPGAGPQPHANCNPYQVAEFTSVRSLSSTSASPAESRRAA